MCSEMLTVLLKHSYAFARPKNFGEEMYLLYDFFLLLLLSACLFEITFATPQGTPVDRHIM